MSLSELFNRLRTKGPVSTLQSVLSVVEDIRFDRRYQLDTSAEVAIRDLDISDGDRRHADKYKPTRVRYFHRLMRRIELPPGGVFVDVGCGKNWLEAH